MPERELAWHWACSLKTLHMRAPCIQLRMCLTLPAPCPTLLGVFPASLSALFRYNYRMDNSRGALDDVFTLNAVAAE